MWQHSRTPLQTSYCCCLKLKLNFKLNAEQWFEDHGIPAIISRGTVINKKLIVFFLKQGIWKHKIFWRSALGQADSTTVGRMHWVREHGIMFSQLTSFSMFFLYRLSFSHTCNLNPQCYNVNLFPTVIYPQKSAIHTPKLQRCGFWTVSGATSELFTRRQVLHFCREKRTQSTNVLSQGIMVTFNVC